MRNVHLPLLSIIISTTLLMGGGDLIPSTPHEIDQYETQDLVAAEVVPVTPTESSVNIAPIALPKVDVSPLYVGLGLVAARYDAKCQTAINQCTVDKTGGVLVRGGYDFNTYMGLEARGLITSMKSNGGKVKHLGAFAKPMYPMSEDVNLYGLLGYAKTTTQGSMRRTDVRGLAMGAGIEYDFSEDKKKEGKYDRAFDGQADQEKGFGVFADYERLYQKSNAPDLDAVSVGLTYDF